METNAALASFAGLSQESRLEIFRLLIEHGGEGLAAGAIGARLGLANATLSFHLKELSHAELVRVRREGRSLIYSANLDTINGLMTFLTENCCRASGEMCAPGGSALVRPAARPAQKKRRGR